MRKIAHLTFLIATLGLAQQQTYMEETQNTITDAVIRTVAIESANRNPVVATYTTLTDFQAGVSSYCPDPTLTSENFDGGPISITLCGPSIGSFGNLCYEAGELEEGFTVLASDLGNIVYVPAGGLGNVEDALVGANQAFQYTIVTFDPEIYAMAMEIWVNAEPIVQVRVFGVGGELIGVNNLTLTLFQQTFFGVIADEPIERIEMETAHNGAGLIGKFLYGAVCDNIAGVDDNVLYQISLSPNPAVDVVTIQLPQGMELQSVEVYDISGRLISNGLINNQINVSLWPGGIYLLHIHTSRGTVTRKILKS